MTYVPKLSIFILKRQLFYIINKYINLAFFILYYFLDSVSTFGAVLDMVTDRLFSALSLCMHTKDV